MSELEAKLRIRIEGKDEVVGFANRSEQAMQRFGASAERSMQGAGREIAGFGKQVLSAGAALAGLGAGLGIAENVRSVIEYRDALAGLAAVAGKPTSAIAGIREQVNATAISTGQLTKDLTDALEAFVAKTGDLDKGLENLKLYGRVATATRASVKDVAGLGAELGKLGLEKDQANALNIIARQSDVGTMKVSDYVSQAPRIFAAADAAGMHGEKGLREMGAIFQMAMKGTGDKNRATTASEAMLRDVGNFQTEHPGQLESLGIQVFDPKTHAVNDRYEVIKDIIRKTNGRPDLLSRIFKEESIRGVNSIASDFRRTGGFGGEGSLDSYRDVVADPKSIETKFAMNVDTTAARLKDEKIRMARTTDEQMGDSVDALVKNNEAEISKLYAAVMEHPVLYGAGAFLAKKGADSALDFGTKKIGGLAKSIRSRFGGGVGEKAVEALGGAAGEGQKVFVTNWPGGGFGDGGGLKAGTGAGAGGGAAGAGAGGGAGGEVGAALTGGGIGTAAIAIGGAVAGALNLYAAAKAVQPLNDSMPQIEKETADQLRQREQTMKDNAAAEREGAKNLAIHTAGTYGGKVTSAQARAASQGMGSYGMGAGDVLKQFRQQQGTLGAIATGEEAGLDEKFIGEQVEGGSFLLDMISRSNPEFAKAKSGKARGAVLRQMIASNEKDARAPFKGGVVADDWLTTRRGMPESDLAVPEWAQGHENYGRSPSATAAAPNGDADFWAKAKEVMGLNLTINVAPDGTTTTEGDFGAGGTRSTKVLANRTAGPT